MIFLPHDSMAQMLRAGSARVLVITLEHCAAV